jgi:hypothetical protein
MNLFRGKKESEGNPTRTKSGLPIVTRETFDGNVQSHQTGERQWGKRLEETKKRLIAEQPILAMYLDSKMSGYTPELKIAIAEAAIGMYSLLEQQAQVDSLKTRFE